jgi:hypothetical protein
MEEEKNHVAINFEYDSDMTVESWSRDIEIILDNLLENINSLQAEHKKLYIELQSKLIIFRVPLILISSINSVFSVGLNTYVDQSLVSTINCLLSLMCACISSVELFLNINKNMETTLQSYHGYKLLGIKISSCRKLDRDHRDKNALGFMNECISEYKNLLEQSVVLLTDLDDSLLNYKAETKNILLTFGTPTKRIK